MNPYYDDTEYGIRIYHGDCWKILSSVGDFDAIISDPPYGISYVKGPSGGTGCFRGKRGASASRGKDVIEGDDDTFDPTPLLRFKNVLIWGANHYAQALPYQGRWLAWNKLDDMEQFDSFSDVEFAWHSLGKASRICNYKWKGGVACRKKGENNGRRDHPTQKPLGLMRWCIEQSGVLPGQTILDPFMGSGTTLQAAKDMGRKAIGIEIKERYCEIAARRLEQGVFKFSEQVAST